MATELRLRRGTTDEHGNFIGAEAEATVDTDKNTIVVHDGQTQGGFPLAQESDTAPAIDSVASLRTSSFPANLKRLYLSGYYGQGTPGGGELYYDSADTTTADNGGTIFVDADGKRWKRQDKGYILVTDFGAKPSGNNEDATINSDAFDAANTYTAGNNQTLYIPGGDYRHDRTITFSGNKSVIGAGMLASTLRITTDNLGVDNRCQGFVDGLEIDGDQVTSPSSNGLHITVSGRIHIGYIEVRNFKHGCIYKEANSSIIDHLICRGNSGIGFWMDASSVDTNGVNFFIDSRSNGSDGVVMGEQDLGDDIAQPRQCKGVVSSQANGGYGIRIRSRSNFITSYEENNTSGGILFEGAGAFGNWVYTQTNQNSAEASDASGSPGTNIVYGILKTTSEVGYSELITKKLTLPQFDFAGQMALTHPSDARYNIEFSRTGQVQGITVKNLESGYDAFFDVEGEITANTVQVEDSLLLYSPSDDGGSEITTFSSGSIDINPYKTSKQLNFYINSYDLTVGGVVKPRADNTYTLGTSSQRWSEVFAANGTINTSDRDEKQQINPIDDALLDAWGDVEWVQYKWNHAVDEKGTDARWHTGLIAQQVKESLEAHGLNPFDYGLLCWDEWENEDGTIDSRYGVRYNECHAVEAAWVRRKLAKL